jgi:hypothetical protein
VKATFSFGSFLAASGDQGGLPVNPLGHAPNLRCNLQGKEIRSRI